MKNINERLEEAGVMVHKPKRVGVNIRVPEKLVKRLDKVINGCDDKNINRSAVMIIALDEFLKKWKVKEVI